jgi:thioredoxin 1
MNKVLILFVLLISVFLNSCSAQEKPKVTFIELGSVKCIPCQKMQKVIKQVENQYSEQVKTIFYDVWTKEGEPFADQYNINLIPTQIFLDSNGKEYYRHEGYFEFEKLEKILLQKIPK